MAHPHTPNRSLSIPRVFVRLLGWVYEDAFVCNCRCVCGWFRLSAITNTFNCFTHSFGLVL